MRATAAITIRKPGATTDGLLETFHSAFVGGRWLLALAETTVTFLLLAGGGLSERAILALLLLFAYNLAALAVVHRVPTRHLPALGLLALDLLFVALAAYHTGGAGSPFLSQCYLVILAAALFYGLPGGILAGAAATFIAGALALEDRSALGRIARDLAPYFLLGGVFTGYLVERLRAWFRSYQQSAAREREREVGAEAARREMEIARAIQRAALPAAPSIPGLEIAVRSEYAREVGGDFHLFLHDGERLGLVLGDVSGKGIPAALIATSIAHLLPWLRPLEDPAGALGDLNRDLIEHVPGDVFVTLVLAEADTGAGTLRLWNAGHPPALLWRAGERQVRESCVHNFFLAFREPWEGEPECLPFEAGDVLLLYSDGLIEARNDGGGQFGSTRAACALGQSAAGSAEEIADALVRSVRGWGALTDDLTILVCKRVL